MSRDRMPNKIKEQEWGGNAGKVSERNDAVIGKKDNEV